MASDLCISLLSSRNVPVESSTKKLLKTSTHNSSHKEVCDHRFVFPASLSQTFLSSSVLWTDKDCLEFMFTKIACPEYFNLPSKKMTVRDEGRK